VVDQQAYNKELYQTARMVLSSIRTSLEDAYPPQSISGPDGRYVDELQLALEATLTSFEIADHGTADANLELAFPLTEINKRSSEILRVPFHLIPQAKHEETSALTRRFFGPLFVGQALRLLENLLLASARSREPSSRSTCGLLQRFSYVCFSEGAGTEQARPKLRLVRRSAVWGISSTITSS
jgi:hypothetical protein